MAKIVTLFAFGCILLSQAAHAETLPVNAYVFYGDGCPHCGAERYYLSHELTEKYPNVNIREYEIYNNQDNILLLQEVAKKLDVIVDGVPFLIIGDQTFVGFADGISSSQIENRVRTCSVDACPDSVASIVGVANPTLERIKEPTGTPEIVAIGTKTDAERASDASNDREIGSAEELTTIELPLLGKIDAMDFSLPMLTIVMGALDGFNPCAMWTLLFLISLLLGIENRKRMWLLGSAFIVASASVYFLFMSAWLNLILFLGFVIWVRILIGSVALIGGGYSIKEFIFNKESGCKIAGDETRRKTFEKLKRIVQQNSLWLSLGGIIALAFAVNLVELICSAGLPAIYTQVLALNDLMPWQRYLYILLYIFFFMLDDLFVFFVAMITLQMTGITTKYTRVSRLVGGLIMLAIGLMLIFKPGWLMFG